MPPAFEYYSPTGVDEVIDLLDKFGEDAKILAGGQSLIPLLKTRITTIPHLISLSEIKNLSYVSEGADSIKIGAMTLDSDLEYNDSIKAKFPVLSDALDRLGDPLVGNMGTVGGYISHGDPGNDLPPVMIALGAKYIIRGKTGSRIVNASDFYVDTFVTVLEHDEVLTEIEVPFWPKGSSGAYVKFEKGTWNFSVAGTAAQLQLQDGKIARAGLAIASMAPTVLRVKEAEEFLVGRSPDESVFLEAADIACGNSSPSQDSFGTVDYKKDILRRITVSALRKAANRAGGLRA